jgi:hypothetical protein
MCATKADVDKPDNPVRSFELFGGFGTAGDGINTSVALDYVRVDAVVIPAPDALLQASIGAGLVGWLRRRRTL